MSAPIAYRVEVLNPNAHLFAVTLEIAQAAPRQQVSLPAWIPGSYLVREFAQHLQHLQACDGEQAVPLRQLDKHTWELAADLPPAGVLTLRYEVYAFDASVRTAFLDSTRGFFNPTSLCLRVHGQDDQPHSLIVEANAHTRGWQLATGLIPLQIDPDGFGHYTAPDYDTLADCPVEMGRFWSGQFEVRGVPHRFVVSGAGAHWDRERLLRDTQAICEAEMAFWHGPEGKPPFDSYLFMLHASADGYGGLEHRNSTALICQRSDLPQRVTDGATPAPLKATDGYTTLLGLISHEYFHTWNVKRLRPQEFRQYDYGRENHTELLWFFEGFTSYYDDLLVRRACLIDHATWLTLMSKTINQVLQTPGRQVQTVAEASFDAWTKFYRVQENTPNATVSYYTKGALVALCLDLTLRQEGLTTLDEVMRALWIDCQGGPMSERDLLDTLQRLGGRSFEHELQQWVHSTLELPLRPLLEQAGVVWHEDPAPLAQQLGVRVNEATGLVLKNVLRGSPAEAAGLAANDEWLGVECLDPQTGQVDTWRVRKLDEVAVFARGQGTVTAIVARDGRILRCPLQWPGTPSTAARLTAPEPVPATLSNWLNGRNPV